MYYFLQLHVYLQLSQSLMQKKKNIYIYRMLWSGLGYPSGSDGEESTCNARDMGSIPGLGRSPGEGNGSPLQYSCLGDPMDRGAWRATVHGVTKESDTTERLSNNLEILHQLRVWPRKFSLLSGPVPTPLALLTAPPLVLTEGATLSPPSP